MFNKKQKEKTILYPPNNIKKNIDGIYVLTEKESKNKIEYTPDNTPDNKREPGPTEQQPKEDCDKIRKIKLPNTQEIPKKPRAPSRLYILILSTMAILAISILPIKLLNTANNLKAQAKDTLTHFESAYNSLKNSDYEKAKNELVLAQKEIRELEDNLTRNGQKNTFISRFVPVKDITINNENLLDIVSSLSNIGVSLIDNIYDIENLNIGEIKENQENQNLFTKIEKLSQDITKTEDDFEEIKEKLLLINENRLNDHEKEYFGILKNKIEIINKYYYALLDGTKELPYLLGKNYDKKYLLLFQNNTELRATGGFIGTYGILTIRDAKIKNIFIDSIYNPDGQISKYIDPPDPLKKITDHLTMRDANWYPNFPDSAKQISDIYELEGGFTPDGIIAFDTEIFLDLLDITGPIALEEYGMEIGKENFISETQYKTSIDYDDNSNPKKFIGELAPLLLERVFEVAKENQGLLINILLNNISEKHIQFYSPKEGIQNIISSLKLSGEIEEFDGDYFSYINTNIGGMKTSMEIDEKTNHRININSNGNIIHTVNIERQHNGSYNWPSGINYSYMRFYIPLGSEIIEIDGFEKKEDISKNQEDGMLYSIENMPKANISDLDIYEENGKTVIGAWQVIKPGENIKSSITYKLPFGISSLKLKDQYNLLIQKQAGVISQETSIWVNSSKNHKITIPGTDRKRNNYNISFDLIEDREIELIISK